MLIFVYLNEWWTNFLPRDSWAASGYGADVMPCHTIRVSYTHNAIILLKPISDKTLIVWKLTRDETNYGVPQKRLYGHSHFISDVVLSSDGNYALSGSWDKTLRLWDLAAGKTTRRFEDHTKVWRIFILLVLVPMRGRRHSLRAFARQKISSDCLEGWVLCLCEAEDLSPCNRNSRK